jgi:hypothetical protein
MSLSISTGETGSTGSMDVSLLTDEREEGTISSFLLNILTPSEV